MSKKEKLKNWSRELFIAILGSLIASYLLMGKMPLEINVLNILRIIAFIVLFLVYGWIIKIMEQKKYKSEIEGLKADILNRDVQEKELQKPIVKFRQIIEAFLDPIFLQDQNDKSLNLIHKYERIQKQDAASILGATLLEKLYSSLRITIKSEKCDLITMKEALDLFIDQAQTIFNRSRLPRTHYGDSRIPAEMEAIINRYNEFIEKINDFCVDNFEKPKPYTTIT